MKKDITEKNLISNNDVFADILNANRLFGEYQILPEELASLPTDFSYKDLDGEHRALYRDCLKEVQRLGVSILFIGVENQEKINNIMPVRDMGYVYTAYMHQIRKLMAENSRQGKPAYAKVLHDGQRLKPVVTFVLYFGSEKWERPLSLLDVLELDPEQKELIRKYLPDYRIHVIPMRNQPEEVRKRYQSDFGIIADVLAYQGNERHKLKEYVRNNRHILIHAEQTLDLLRALTGSRTMEILYKHYMEIMPQEKKEGIIMEDCFEDYFNELKEEMEAEFDIKYKELAQKQAAITQQQAAITQQQVEFDQQKAEINRKQAEFDQQKAQFDQRERDLTEQKRLIIRNLMGIWDISTIAQNTGFSIAEIEQVAAQY